MSEETFRWVITGGVGLAALAFVIVAVVAVVLASVFLKLKAKLEPILETFQPIARNISETVTNLKPKIAKISDQAVDMSQLVTTEAHRYSEIIRPRVDKISGQVVEVSDLVVTEAHRYSGISKDIADRAKSKVAQIDGAMDETVEHVQEAGVAVKSAVLRPFREVDAVFTGVRAALLTLARGSRTTVSRATQDEEMFI